MDSNSKKNIAEDEIDFKSLWSKIYAILTYPFALLFSNALTTLVFVVAAILLATSLKYFLPKSYSASFIIKPLDRNERVHLKTLKDIQTLLKFHDYPALSKMLDLPDSVTKKLAGLKTYNPSLKTPTDSVNTTEIFIITSDYNLFPVFQTALLNYLENSPYFLKIKNLQKEQIALELNQVEKDIAGLDSLKTLQLKHYDKQGVGNQNTVLLSELINPTATYTLAIERVNKKSNLLARAAFLDNFQLIKPCPVIRNHTSPPRILIMCVYLLPVFLVLCVIFLHFKNWRKIKKSVRSDH